MTDDLEKYEKLASRAKEPPFWVLNSPEDLLSEAADAITELVAMARGARELNKAQHQLIQEQLNRAEAAERELAKLKRKMGEQNG